MPLLLSNKPNNPMKYRIVVLMLLASALYGCGTRTNPEENAAGPWFTSDENGVTVTKGSPLSEKLQLAEVIPQRVDMPLKTTASVGHRSGSVAEIGLPFGGRIIRSFVRLGDPVRRGQALFEVSSSDYMEAVKEYLESRSTADRANANRQREETIHQSGMLSDREWEEVCAEARNAENACELARRSLALFQVDPSSVQVGEPLRVVSPIAGRVVRNDLVIGGYLAEDDEAPMTVADLSKVWVTAHVKAPQVAGLAAGQNVEVEAGPGQQVPGRIFYVGELLDERTRTLPVVIECDNAQRLLKPGMFVTAVFDRLASEVLVIPSSAVFQGEGSKFVYVRDAENHFVKAPVHVESLDGGRQRVLAGLDGGETIIAAGGIYLSE